MIIDKILAQGEYIEANEQHGFAQYYQFYFVTLDGSLNITVKPDVGPSEMTYEQVLSQNKSIREQMLRKLCHELRTILGIQPNEDANYFSIHDDSRMLNIKGVAIERLFDYANTHGDASLQERGLEQLPIALTIINFFNILYFSKSYFDRYQTMPRPINHLHDIFIPIFDIANNANKGLVCYTVDRLKVATPNHFYITNLFPDLPDEKITAKINKSLITQLRRAVIHGLTRLGCSNIEEGEPDSIYLSNSQFSELRKCVGLPPLLPTLVADSPAVSRNESKRESVNADQALPQSTSNNSQNKEMIFDKIIAQGEVIFGNKNDHTYEKYIFEFDTSSGAVSFIVDTAVIDKFVGTTYKDRKDAQQAMLKQMLQKILTELAILIIPYENETKEEFNELKSSRALCFTDNDFRKLTITEAATQRIFGEFYFKNKNRLQQFGLVQFDHAIQILRLLRGMHFHFTQKQIENALKKMLSNEAEKNMRLYYRVDQNNTHDKKHQLYLGSLYRNSLNEQVKINKSLAYQLRMAVKCGIAKLMNRPSVDFIEDTHYVASNASEHNLALNLADRDFNMLKFSLCPESEFNTEQAVLPLQHPIAAENADRGVSIELGPSNSLYSSQVDSAPAVIELNFTGEDEKRIYSPAASVIISDLNGKFLSNLVNKISPPARKESNIDAVSTKCLEIQDIKILSELYRFINQEKIKEQLNIHANAVYDWVFFKKHTNSWQKLIEDIRKHALNKLLESSGVEEFTFEAIINEKTTHILNPKEVKEKLIPYLHDTLFCEHRSNNIIRNQLHETTAVKNIRKVIAACDAQIKYEEDICKKSILVKP